jgi:ParB-like nuclease domain
MKCYHFDDDGEDLEMLLPKLKSCWPELREIVRQEMGLDDPGELFIEQQHDGPAALRELSEHWADYQLYFLDLMDVENPPVEGGIHRGTEIAKLIREKESENPSHDKTSAIIAISRAEQSVVHVGRVRRKFEEYAKRLLGLGPHGTWGCGYLNKSELIVDDDHPSYELTNEELARFLIPILIDAGVIDTRVSVDRLELDQDNFRLAGVAWESLQAKINQQTMTRLFWDELDAEELARSMLSAGYLEQEPLYVEHLKEGRLLVVEGNRRLAALKGLRDQSICAAFGIEISEKESGTLSKVPIILLHKDPKHPSRVRFARYLAFRHINSSLRWGTYAKAHYIAELLHKHMGDTPRQLSDLPYALGDSFGTVPMLYRAHQVLDQAERAGVYNRRWRANYPSKLAFAQLVFGLQRPGVVEFLGMQNSPKDAFDPVPADHLDKLRQLMIWVFGDYSQKGEEIESVMTPSDDWGALEEVLLDPVALEKLRGGAAISEANEEIQPTTAQLTAALVSCEQSLLEARELLPLIGTANVLQMDIANNLKSLSEQCQNMAESIGTGAPRLNLPE